MRTTHTVRHAFPHLFAQGKVHLHLLSNASVIPLKSICAPSRCMHNAAMPRRRCICAACKCSFTRCPSIDGAVKCTRRAHAFAQRPWTAQAERRHFRSGCHTLFAMSNVCQFKCHHRHSKARALTARGARSLAQSALCLVARCWPDMPAVWRAPCAPAQCVNSVEGQGSRVNYIISTIAANFSQI